MLERALVESMDVTTIEPHPLIFTWFDWLASIIAPIPLTGLRAGRIRHVSQQVPHPPPLGIINGNRGSPRLRQFKPNRIGRRR